MTKKPSHLRQKKGRTSNNKVAQQGKTHGFPLSGIYYTSFTSVQTNPLGFEY